VTAGCSSCSV